MLEFRTAVFWQILRKFRGGAVPTRKPVGSEDFAVAEFGFFEIREGDGGLFLVASVSAPGDSEASAQHGDARGCRAGVGEKLDITACSKVWLEGAAARGMKHICWDGCMFPNATLENPKTWNTILSAMVKVKQAL